MQSPMQWRRGPRPDEAVIELLERVLEAAHKGHVRAVGIVTLDPMLQSETLRAGDLDQVRAHLLAAGHTKAANQLLADSSE